MLSHVEITARVELSQAAHFGWSNKVEFSHDCFVCRRTGRTVTLHHGASHGLCHSSRQPLEWQDEQAGTGSHPAPIRITGFDVAGGATGKTLRCRVSFWWSPFTDLQRPQAQVGELGAGPWARLHYRVGCHACRDAGEADWFNGEQSLQTNTVLPVVRPCTRCGTDLVTMPGAPEITLVG
ncbi:hypothetical protein [Lentzea cavernae]|uniref:Uncharacterized protein n=1 Tax=Lentzea cavernae TaxID=2020703 RepID=A0ABQ3MXK7_9PSEU|nr:hypothetical protein [Lentzea cavernae]GHH61891.1 hypothetical protein GCM10017774_88860 [Lentzea cavernae]